ncbi:MAG: phosphotransferase [Treponema sp.]
MKITHLFDNKLLERREESEFITVLHQNNKIVIKKPVDEKAAKAELEIVSFLNKHNFNTYHIINNEFEDADGYIIYKHINGVDGFYTQRNSNYFYSVGKHIGILHTLLQDYAKSKNKKTSYIHGDLHSGNIIVDNEKIYIIDFSSVVEDWQCNDLLNIEYEAFFEKDSEEKRKAFVTGYCEQLKISYPNKEYVLQKIMENDFNEYKRWEKRGWKNSEYHTHLKGCVETHQPTFIPIWL